MGEFGGGRMSDKLLKRLWLYEEKEQKFLLDKRGGKFQKLQTTEKLFLLILESLSLESVRRDETKKVLFTCTSF